MQKLYNISILRFIAVVILFFHHVVCGIMQDGNISITYFPFTFAVDVFLFVSAFLYGQKEIKNFKQFFKKRFLFIFLPYYIFVFIVFFVYLIFMPNQISVWEFFKGLFCLYVFDSAYNSLGHFWFLPIIMICYLFIPLLQLYYKENTSSKIKFFLKLLFAIIIIGEICFSFWGHHLQFVSFIAGYYIAKQKDYKKISPLKSGAVFLLGVVVYLFVHGFYALGDSEYLRNGIGFCVMFVCAISFSLFILTIFEFLNKKEHKILQFCDKISYPFYIVHHPLVIKNLSLLYITPFITLNIGFAFLTSIYLAYILYLIMQKVLNRIL